MRDVCDLLDALPVPPKYECGPYGITIAPFVPDSPFGWYECRIQNGSGIAGRGNHWAVVDIASGTRTKLTNVKRDLRQLIIEHLAGPRPVLPSHLAQSHCLYARWSGNATTIGSGCGYIWVMRRARKAA